MCDRVVKCEPMKGGQRRNFLVCALAQPLGDTPRPALRGETRHPARSGLSLKFKVWEPEAVSRDPYTRLAAGRSGRNSYGTTMCSFQGDVLISRPALCRLPLWPIEAPSIAPSFHEPFGRWLDNPSLLSMWSSPFQCTCRCGCKLSASGWPRVC